MGNESSLFLNVSVGTKQTALSQKPITLMSANHHCGKTGLYNEYSLHVNMSNDFMKPQKVSLWEMGYVSNSSAEICDFKESFSLNEEESIKNFNTKIRSYKRIV